MRFYCNSKIAQYFLAGVFALSLLFFEQPASVLADSSPKLHAELEKIANDMSNSIMSPFCPGRTLAACPSPQAREMRQQILSWLVEGSSPEEIDDRLRGIYGAEIIGAPDAVGVGILAWLMPGVFLLVLALGIVLVLRRLSSERSSLLRTREDGREVVRKYSKQVEQELKRRMA